jgi:hypothetical protein
VTDPANMLLNMKRPLIQMYNCVCDHMQVSDLDIVRDLLKAPGFTHLKRRNNGIG